MLFASLVSVLNGVLFQIVFCFEIMKHVIVSGSREYAFSLPSPPLSALLFRAFQRASLSACQCAFGIEKTATVSPRFKVTKPTCGAALFFRTGILQPAVMSSFLTPRSLRARFFLTRVPFAQRSSASVEVLETSAPRSGSGIG